jgi:hypothetical protein
MNVKALEMLSNMMWKFSTQVIKTCFEIIALKSLIDNSIYCKYFE